jgi:hypothetical protein
VSVTVTPLVTVTLTVTVAVEEKLAKNFGWSQLSPMVASMRLSLHKKPSFLPSTVPTPIDRARDSLPPMPARRSRWMLVVIAALLSATVAFAANKVAKRESENAPAVRLSAADDDTRALLDERLYAHLKRLQ